jgi:hypothetical protein
MKILKFKSLFVLIVSLSLFTGCGDDNTEEVSPYVGNYVISKAALVDPLSIPIAGLPNPISLAAGFDITSGIQTAILGTAGCASADKSWIELKKDFTMFMSCEGTNPKNAGTWQEVSATVLKLNMNASALPPQGFALDVTNMEVTSTGIKGKAIIPIPKTMIAAMIAQINPLIQLDPSASSVFMVSMSIEFTKK